MDLVSIGQKRRETPYDTLHAAHDRLREYDAQAVRLVNGWQSPPEQIRAWAAELTRFAGEAVENHRDEEVSAAPRLERSGVDVSLARHLQTMREQHRELEASLARLHALWQRLAEAPEGIMDVLSTLASVGSDVSYLLHSNLMLEEQTVFPAIEALPPALQDEIVEDMKRRRKAKD